MPASGAAGRALARAAAAGALALVAGAACSSASKGGRSLGMQALIERGICAEPAEIAHAGRKGKGRRGVVTPLVTGVAPGEGIGLGGTTITVTGEGFQQGATVQLGESMCTGAQVVDPNTITCVTSAHPAGHAEILIINPDRQCASLGRAFRFLSNVAISPRTKVVAVNNAFKFSAAQGKPPYTFQLLQGEGAIDSGTGEYKAPDKPGSAIIRVTDAVNTYSDAIITVNPALQVVPTQTAGTNGYKFDVVGGAPPITYSIKSGDEAADEDPSRPRASTGALVKVVDSMGNTAEIALDLSRTPPMILYPATTQVVPGDRVNFMPSGGKPPYVFSVEGGRGKIDPQTGIYTAPNEPGTETIKVTDAAGNTQVAQVTVTQEAFSVSRLALGFGHTCAAAGGAVRCWGDNRYGQLGNGTLIDRRKPTPVVGLGRDTLSIVAGHSHTCAITAGGSARCWGDNRYGQLGDGSDVSATMPVGVLGLSSGAQSIAAGQYHSCAVVRGAVYCWGSNRRGQLGNSSVVPSASPVSVRGLTEGVVSVATGAAHSCALTKEGGVKCWGYNYSGQLGDGTVQDRLVPADVVGLKSGVQAIYAGGYHTCALLEGGKLKCWGNNGLGQLGNNTTKTMLVPTDVAGISGPVKYASAGYFHTCAWVDGAAKCWGYNRDGQLGDNAKASRSPRPTSVSDLSGEVLNIAAGVNHSCALVPEGVRCWGSNEFGQFGDRSVASSPIPVPAAPLQ